MAPIVGFGWICTIILISTPARMRHFLLKQGITGI
jgi:hypothetical protein